jgi:hypothetical protein
MAAKQKVPRPKNDFPPPPLSLERQSDNIKRLQDFYEAANLKLKEMNSGGGGNIYVKAHGQRASKVFAALSSLLYASIAAAKSDSLEEYVRQTAAALPATVVDLEEWNGALALARATRSLAARYPDPQTLPRSLGVASNGGSSNSNNASAPASDLEDLQRKLKFCNYLVSQHPLGSVRDELQLFKRLVLQLLSSFQADFNLVFNLVQQGITKAMLKKDGDKFSSEDKFNLAKRELKTLLKEVELRDHKILEVETHYKKEVEDREQKILEVEDHYKREVELRDQQISLRERRQEELLQRIQQLEVELENERSSKEEYMAKYASSTADMKSSAGTIVKCAAEYVCSSAISSVLLSTTVLGEDKLRATYQQQLDALSQELQHTKQQLQLVLEVQAGFEHNEELKNEEVQKLKVELLEYKSKYENSEGETKRLRDKHSQDVEMYKQKLEELSQQLAAGGSGDAAVAIAPAVEANANTSDAVVQQYEKELKELKDALEDKRSYIVQLEDKLANIAVTNTASTSTTSSSDAKDAPTATDMKYKSAIDVLASEVYTTKEELKNKQACIAQLEEQMGALNATITTLRSTISTLEADNSSLSAKIRTLEEDACSLRSAASALDKQHTADEAVLEEAKKEHAATLALLEEAKEEHTATLALLEQTKQQHVQDVLCLESALAQLKEAIADKDSSILQLQGDISKLKSSSANIDDGSSSAVVSNTGSVGGTSTKYKQELESFTKELILAKEEIASKVALLLSIQQHGNSNSSTDDSNNEVPISSNSSNSSSASNNGSAGARVAPPPAAPDSGSSVYPRELASLHEELSKTRAQLYISSDANQKLQGELAKVQDELASLLQTVQSQCIAVPRAAGSASASGDVLSLVQQLAEQVQLYVDTSQQHEDALLELEHAYLEVVSRCASLKRDLDASTSKLAKVEEKHEKFKMETNDLKQQKIQLEEEHLQLQQENNKLKSNLTNFNLERNMLKLEHENLLDLQSKLTNELELLKLERQSSMYTSSTSSSMYIDGTETPLLSGSVHDLLAYTGASSSNASGCNTGRAKNDNNDAGALAAGSSSTTNSIVVAEYANTIADLESKLNLALAQVEGFSRELIIRENELQECKLKLQLVEDYNTRNRRKSVGLLEVEVLPAIRDEGDDEDSTVSTSSSIKVENSASTSTSRKSVTIADAVEVLPAGCSAGDDNSVGSYISSTSSIADLAAAASNSDALFSPRTAAHYEAQRLVLDFVRLGLSSNSTIIASTNSGSNVGNNTGGGMEEIDNTSMTPSLEKLALQALSVSPDSAVTPNPIVDNTPATTGGNSDTEEAAVLLQALARGYIDRKNLQKTTNPNSASSSTSSNEAPPAAANTDTADPASAPAAVPVENPLATNSVLSTVSNSSTTSNLTNASNASSKEVVRIQSLARGYLDRQRVKHMYIEKLAAMQGVLVACNGTKQGQ